MPKKQNGVPAKTRPTFMLAALRHMSNSMLLGRAKLAAALGQTFGGDRDMYTVLGYKKVLDYDYFDALYTRQDIAGRIVDLPAQSTWKKGPEVRDTDNPDVETEFEMAWESLVRKLRVWHYFRRADQVAGIGQYGVLFLGLPGPLESPAAPVNGAEGLVDLSVYSQPGAPGAPRRPCERAGGPDVPVRIFPAGGLGVQIRVRYGGPPVRAARDVHSRLLEPGEEPTPVGLRQGGPSQGARDEGAEGPLDPGDTHRGRPRA